MSTTCACSPDCTSEIQTDDDIVPVYAANNALARVKTGQRFALLSHLTAWTQMTDDLSERVAALQEAVKTPVVADEAERRVVAAFLLDRADQYAEGSCCIAALTDAASMIINGDARAAALHGELDDLMARVVKMKTRSGDR